MESVKKYGTVLLYACNILLYANFCQHVKKDIMEQCVIMPFHQKAYADRGCIMVLVVLLFFTFEDGPRAGQAPICRALYPGHLPGEESEDRINGNFPCLSG